MAKYRKKPIVIDAMQWTGTNIEEVKEFTNGCDRTITYYKPLVNSPFYTLVISTLEGRMEAKVSDYIIKGIQGEFYPCKADIFHATYEAVNE